MKLHIHTKGGVGLGPTLSNDTSDKLKGGSLAYMCCLFPTILFDKENN